MIKVKVCGLTSAENIREMAGSGIDFAGFIFFPGSSRFAGHKPDPEIFNSVPDTIYRVGVFVNENPENILKYSVIAGLDAVQLHGDEDSDYCRQIRSLGLQVIKTFRIADGFDTERINSYGNVCDYFLFDTATDAYGGSGRKFRWQLLDGLNLNRPFFLAGGIGPDDVENIRKIRNKMFFGVDINSRFETRPGIKDFFKVRKFIESIKSH